MYFYELEACIDGAENFTDQRAEDCENSDNNDSNQNKDQRIFNQTLAFFFDWEQHGNLAPFFIDFLEWSRMISFYIENQKMQAIN